MSVAPHDLLDEEDKGGYIQPVLDCPHLDGLSSSPLTIDLALELLKKGCHDCGIVKENWVCLTCFAPHCGRYQKKHAAHHSEQDQHHLTISLADLNTWCYQCENYVVSERIHPFYLALHLVKFGELPPGCAIDHLSG